jgi:signal peptidase I
LDKSKDEILNNLNSLLMYITAFTGICWIFDFLILKPKRKVELHNREQKSNLPLTKKEKNEILEPNAFWGFIIDCFKYLVIVFIVRCFFYEPFRIPSASMMPTLLRGDFILVEKFAYGISNPFTNEVIIKTSEPKRGDVAVFRYPVDESVDYVKRIVGLPGDLIVLDDGNLFIIPKGTTKKQLLQRKIDKDQYYEGINLSYPSEHGTMYDEDLLGYSHKIMIDDGVVPPINYFVQPNMEYSSWLVPEDCYFAMGDNRDHSADSRFWGFVPRKNLLGKAVVIWFSFSTDDLLRVRRIGGIQ